MKKVMLGLMILTVVLSNSSAHAEMTIPSKKQRTPGISEQTIAGKAAVNRTNKKFAARALVNRTSKRFS